MNSQSGHSNIADLKAGQNIQEILNQQTETLRNPSSNDLHYERPNLAEIPLLVNGLLSHDPQMQGHIAERLVFIAFQDEDCENSSNDLCLSPLIAMLKSTDEVKSQMGFDGLSIIVRKSDKFRQTLIRNGFLEIARLELTDECRPEHVHSNILGIIIDLITNGCNVFEMSGLLPIICKLGSDKDEKKKKISMKAKIIETLLTCQGVISPCSIDEMQELKKQNDQKTKKIEELKRSKEEIIKFNEQKTKENEELKKQIEQLKTGKEELKMNKEQEKQILITEIMKSQIPIQALDKIREDLMIPIIGTEEEKNKIIEIQNNELLFIINTFKGKEDDEGKRRIIECGIIDQLIFIFEKRELNEITRNMSMAFASITMSFNDILILLYQKKPFPCLLRLLDHTDIYIASDGILSILNILFGGANITPNNSIHPYYDAMNACGGIEKIMRLFMKNISKYTKDMAAICIGHLFRAREIRDQQIRVEVIGHLKTLVNNAAKWTKSNSKLILRSLSKNVINRVEIESGVFVIPE